MSPKFLFLALGLIALSCAVDARHFLKRLHEKELSSQPSRTGTKALNTLLRRRRSAEESSEEITDEEAGALMKFFMTVAWHEDKLDVLSGFLDEIADSETNLTVIGWQRIYDEKGNIKEIKTVQLVIPPKPETETGNIVDDDDDDEDENQDDDRLFPYHDINEIKEVFEPFYEMGIPASVTMEEFNKNGKQEVLIYLDKDELYAKEDNFALYNKTEIISSQEVSNFIKHLKPSTVGEPAVLKYDVDGHFVVEQSHVEPHLLGGLMDQYEATDEIILKSPKIIAQISQQYPKKQIPKQLAAEYNKLFPEFSWRVLVDPNNYYITRDIYVVLSYDNFDLDENSNIAYLVYGTKK